MNANMSGDWVEESVCVCVCEPLFSLYTHRVCSLREQRSEFHSVAHSCHLVLLRSSRASEAPEMFSSAACRASRGLSTAAICLQTPRWEAAPGSVERGRFSRPRQLGGEPNGCGADLAPKKTVSMTRVAGRCFRWPIGRLELKKQDALRGGFRGGRRIS